MVRFRREHDADIVARETLLDAALGPFRRLKTSERLRKGRLPAPGLSFVASVDQRLVGTVRLWSITAGPARPALLLGPLAVDAAMRAAGIGAGLVNTAVAHALQLGHRAILLVGAPAYYGRFGFTSARTGALWLPGPSDPERLLALELVDGALVGASGLIGATGRLARREGGTRRSSVAHRAMPPDHRRSRV
jgi:predicted N-acetyltransferase YhbS